MSVLPRGYCALRGAWGPSSGQYTKERAPARSRLRAPSPAPVFTNSTFRSRQQVRAEALHPGDSSACAPAEAGSSRGAVDVRTVTGLLTDCQYPRARNIAMNSGQLRSWKMNPAARLRPFRPRVRVAERGGDRDGRRATEGWELTYRCSPLRLSAALQVARGLVARRGEEGAVSADYVPVAVDADPALPALAVPAPMKRPNSGRGSTGAVGATAGLPRRRRNARRGHRAPVARSCSHRARATPASSGHRLTARESIEAALVISGGRPARRFTATPHEGADRNRPETENAACRGRDRSYSSPAAGSPSNDQRLGTDLCLGRCAVRPGFAA